MEFGCGLEQERTKGGKPLAVRESGRAGKHTVNSGKTDRQNVNGDGRRRNRIHPRAVWNEDPFRNVWLGAIFVSWRWVLGAARMRGRGRRLYARGANACWTNQQTDGYQNGEPDFGEAGLERSVHEYSPSIAEARGRPLLGTANGGITKWSPTSFPGVGGKPRKVWVHCRTHPA